MRRLLSVFLLLSFITVTLVAQTGTAVDNANRVQLAASLDQAIVTSYTLRIVADGQTTDAKAPYVLGKPTPDANRYFYACDSTPSAANCPVNSVRLTGKFCDGLATGAYRFILVTVAGAVTATSAPFSSQYLRCGGVAGGTIQSIQKVS